MTNHENSPNERADRVPDTGTDTGPRMILIDDSELPAPVPSSEHVARSTGRRESLVPPKQLWSFGLRRQPRRRAS